MWSSATPTGCAGAARSAAPSSPALIMPRSERGGTLTLAGFSPGCTHAHRGCAARLTGYARCSCRWAEPHARFTALFERLAIDVLKETDITGACKILRISWDEGWHLMQRAVARGIARKERRVKAAAKGHRYLTLVCDLERATVEHIADERKQASLDGYFAGLSEQERAHIKAVAMDMWEPYVNSVSAHLPDAEQKIVFDRFHIMKHMVESVDTVRKREHRALQAEGLDLLTGSKYLWL